MFDPGASTGRLRVCPFLGGWRALLCGRFSFWVFGRRMTWNIIFRERYKRFVTPYVLRLIDVPPQSQADTGSRQSPTEGGYVSCGDKWMSGNAME